MRTLRYTTAAAAALILGSMSAPERAHAHAQATTTVQFDREIVRILDNHCVMCHVDNGPAFPLVTYEQTYAARWKIRQSVLSRHMSPWAAVPGYGDFANDNSLTQREIDFLVSWAESYGPRNNGAVYTGAALQTPSRPVQARTDFDRWVLGQPDLTIALAETSQRIVIDPKLKSDRWLQGLEFQPGDRRNVHEVSFSIQQSGQWIGSWTPWYGYMSVPDGLAIRLPAGARIVAEIHYQAGSRATSSTGTLGLHFAERAPARGVSNLSLGAKTVMLTGDINVLALQPTLSPEVKSIEVTARIPNAATRVLLFAKDIRSEWPTPYVYRQPVFLPKGTELVARGASITLEVFEGPAIAAQPRRAAPAATKRYELKGIVKSVDAETGRLVVDHEAVPGLMGAMTMSYTVSSRESLKELAAGDEIRSDVVVSDTGSQLENIQVIQPKQ